MSVSGHQLPSGGPPYVSRSKVSAMFREQVAERLQVTERTVYGWLRRGKLPALKLGRLRR